MKKNIFYSFIVAILLSSCQGMDLMPADKMSDGDYLKFMRMAYILL